LAVAKGELDDISLASKDGRAASADDSKNAMDRIDSVMFIFPKQAPSLWSEDANKILSGRMDNQANILGVSSCAAHCVGGEFWRQLPNLSRDT
jgi:hypothetical protein